MRHRIARAAAALLVLSFGLCGVVHAAPQTGWWWNPGESGRGFFVESHDGITFIGAYLYESDGHATWYVAGGANADSYNYTGPLYNMSRGQTLFGSYVPAVGPNTVGTITVHFSDDTHGTVTWPGGTVAIEREIFGTGDAAFQPDNGWWWNADEGGSGYSLEVQGGNLFLVGFMYDDAGRAVWYFSAGPMSSPTTYHGDVLQFAGGQTLAGAYQPPGNPTKVATLDITFTAENDATATFTDLSGTATTKTKASRGNRWTPQFPKPGNYVPPASFSGRFTLNDITHDISTPGLIYTAQHTVELNFGFKAVGAPEPVNGVVTQGYSVDFTNATITVTFNATGVTEAGTCTQTGAQTLPLGGGSYIDSLSVTTYRKYYLLVYVDVGDLLPVTQTCVFASGGSATTTLALPIAGVNFNYEGGVVGDTIAGGGTKTESTSGVTQTLHYEWSFAGAR